MRELPSLESVRCRIGIDLLGGDHSPKLFLDALALGLQRYPFLHCVVYMTASLQEQLRSESPVHILWNQERFAFELVDEVVAMGDDPLLAVRKKKNSSLMRGIHALKRQKIDALLSNGNTGALIAGSALFLPRLPSVTRPALIATIPVHQNPVSLLDVGGYLGSRAAHLTQRALLGAFFHRVYWDKERPRVGLLNVGNESKKGTRELRSAYDALMHPRFTRHFDFVGNCEPRDLFAGKLDVLVCDGFSGNVLLKTTEGVVHSLLQLSAQENTPSMLHLLQKIAQRFNQEAHRSALLCGVDRLVIKCHGDAKGDELLDGIDFAVKLSEQKTVQQIRGALAAWETAWEAEGSSTSSY